MFLLDTLGKYYNLRYNLRLNILTVLLLTDLSTSRLRNTNRKFTYAIKKFQRQIFELQITTQHKKTQLLNRRL